MFTRTFKLAGENEFIADNLPSVDDFPDTDKMPLDDFKETDFADSCLAEEMDRDTVPAELMAEMDASRVSMNKEVKTEKVKPFWANDFTDSASDITSGTEVKELDSDLFSRYFNK